VLQRGRGGTGDLENESTRVLRPRKIVSYSLKKIPAKKPKKIPKRLTKKHATEPKKKIEPSQKPLETKAVSKKQSKIPPTIKKSIPVPKEIEVKKNDPFWKKLTDE